VAKGFRRRLKAYRLLRQPQAAVVLGGASKKQPWTVEETETSLIVRDANGQGARLRLFRGGAGKSAAGNLRTRSEIVRCSA
jgi:hypothetical protein